MQPWGQNPGLCVLWASADHPSHILRLSSGFNRCLLIGFYGVREPVLPVLVYPRVCKLGVGCLPSSVAIASLNLWSLSHTKLCRASSGPQASTLKSCGLCGPNCNSSLTSPWQRPLGSWNLPTRLAIWEFKLESLGWERSLAGRRVIPISFRDWAGHRG